MKNYDRIQRFVPAFYRDVLEMDEIYRVDGEMLDELLENVDRVKQNQFILSADEATTEEMEHFMKLDVDKTKTLDERRRTIAAYFAGFGKFNKTKIKEMMWYFTGTSTEVMLKAFDAAGNQAMYITLRRGENEKIDSAAISKLLNDKRQAHIMIVCTVLYTNRELKNHGITYRQLKEFTYNQIKNGIPLERMI